MRNQRIEQNCINLQPIELKQFYTERAISKKLTDLLTVPAAKSCLELSAGEGSLLDTVLETYPDISITAVDLDPKNFQTLTLKYPQHTILCGDSTDLETIKRIDGTLYDIAVCNPPFKTVENKIHFRKIIKKILGKEVLSKTIRAELIFLCLNLSLLKQNGHLAIILPELFFHSPSYAWFREAIANKFVISTIIECDHNSFQKTEAKTHIYHIIKTKSQQLSPINHVVDDSAHRISKHSFINKTLDDNSSNCLDKHYSICRGRFSGKECKESKLPYFHTTSFNDHTENPAQISSELVHGITAIEGDVLIARVGTRVIGKTHVFSGSPALISDCIFRLRFNDFSLRDYFLKEWLSIREEWLKKNSYGTCAKHFSIRSMKNLVDSIIIKKIDQL